MDVSEMKAIVDRHLKAEGAGDVEGAISVYTDDVVHDAVGFPGSPKLGIFGRRSLERIAMKATRTLFAVAVTLTVFAAQAATASAGPNGGNAPAAKACQKGGYQSLARAESPSVAFTSSDECTSYAAQGGTLTPLQTVNLEAFREACEAISGTSYVGFITDGYGTVSFNCYHGTANGYEATFRAACEEMNGTFTYREWTYDGYADGFNANCGGIPRPV